MSRTHHSNFSRYSTDYCNRNTTHRSKPDYKEHITVEVWQDTYIIGTAHINLEGPKSFEGVTIEWITMGPPVREVWEPRAASGAHHSQGININTGDNVAIKLEHVSMNPSLLWKEMCHVCIISLI